jgi:hypothetical protein
VLATREGHLLLEVGCSDYRSTDGARTLLRVGRRSVPRALPGPGGYAENTANDSYGIWLSPDGGEWTYVPPPAVP